jgi:hypothetical protein
MTTKCPRERDQEGSLGGASELLYLDGAPKKRMDS